jgi:hypothetical protein
VALLVLEGGGPSADLWVRETERHEIYMLKMIYFVSRADQLGELRAEDIEVLRRLLGLVHGGEGLAGDLVDGRCSSSPG